MRALLDSKLGVRLATADDERFIQKLAQVAFGEYDPHAARTTASMLRQAGAQTLVAVRGDEPLGFIIVRPQARQALAVDAIAVTPRERGRRVGKLLMQSAEQHAKAHGIARITLCTAQANLAALDLFLRQGFVITGRAARYWGKQPACTLEKRIG